MATPASPGPQVRLFKSGQAQMRSAMFTQPATRPVLLRRLNSLTSSTWTDWVPVYVYLISHPTEGHILFDTGLSPDCSHGDYMPCWSPLRYMGRYECREEEAIVKQLSGAGVDQVDKVVISHLHHDHAGGLAQFGGDGKVPVYLSKEHWKAFGANWLWSTIEGALPQHWPKNFIPSFLEAKVGDAEGPDIKPFERSYPLTKDGKVVAVDTPGHTAGHISILVFAEDVIYFLLGDATYHQDLVDREETDGVNDDPRTAVETVRKIKEFCRRKGNVVLLPAHDPGAPKRLEEKIVYKPSDMAVNKS
jgi:glyoxylase-like metal-dependent hydrolase (beta-lactamase superfamily II)